LYLGNNKIQEFLEGTVCRYPGGVLCPGDFTMVSLLSHHYVHSFEKTSGTSTESIRISRHISCGIWNIYPYEGTGAEELYLTS